MQLHIDDLLDQQYLRRCGFCITHSFWATKKKLFQSAGDDGEHQDLYQKEQLLASLNDGRVLIKDRKEIFAL